jgi:predicted O-methyltransferase YrrM
MAGVVTKVRRLAARAIAPHGEALPERWILDLYPAVSDLVVPLGDVTYRPSNLGPYEQFCVLAVAMLLDVRRVFEFGTYDGATSLAIARACPAAEVWTLDLDAPAGPYEVENGHLVEGGVGSRFVGQPEAGRIHQLLGDSTTFDLASYDGMDLVIVDASHEYDAVVSDSANALRMVRPGGVVLWDDYLPGWPGVTRALHELRAAGHPVEQIASTQMAILLT